MTTIELLRKAANEIARLHNCSPQHPLVERLDSLADRMESVVNQQLTTDLADLQRENLEQARLLGISAERELRLQARIAELRRLLKKASGEMSHGRWSSDFREEVETALKTAAPERGRVMGDRELIELAAKAHGDLAYVEDMGWIHEDKNGNRGAWWNPLENDGDALRLAVRLQMEFIVGVKAVSVSAGIGDHIEPLDGDSYAATRRAIVRAAAEIQMAKGE